MYTITCKNITRSYSNYGMHAEQMLAFTLTNEIRKHDHVAFDKGSDIPEYHMSVKSAKATIASAKLMHTDTKEGQIDEYFQRVASECFAYVTKDGIAYVMDMTEFRNFLETFVTMARESSKNGGGVKMRLCSETKAMLAWLASMATI